MKERIVKEFLTVRMKKGAKLLLGLSGGPDSMALLYFLLECLPTLNFSLHLAHIDHGWREESREEAQALGKLAKQLKLPFHLHTLKEISGSDLENRCRLERMAFFSRLHQEHDFEALLLAHHKGDQAETVLKRVFEGAGLNGLRGLCPEKKWGNLTVWRPLLAFSKEELIAFLGRKHVSYFEDPTNRDISYLRSRMRESIFPEIERLFGKNIQDNCVRLGQLCEQLTSYFEEKSVGIEEHLIKGPFGDYLPLKFHSMELKYFLKRYAGEAHLSSDALELLLRLIQKSVGNRQVHAPPLTFHINRAHLFILKRPFPNFFDQQLRWSTVLKGSWQTFWQGEVAIPQGDFQMESFSNLSPPFKKKLKKWYRSHEVPNFFWEKAPVFMHQGKVVGECLTGEFLSS